MALAQTGLNISIFFVLLPKYLALHSTSFNRRVANLDFVDGGMLYQVLTLSMHWWPVEVDIRLISKFQRRLRFIQIIYVSVKLLQGAVCVIDGLCLDPVQIGGDSGVHARLRAATARASADHANSVDPVVRGVCVVDTATGIGLEGGRERERAIQMQGLEQLRNPIATHLARILIRGEGADRVLIGIHIIRLASRH